MRNILACIIICLNLFPILEQECKDIVYPSNKDTTIFNCCIIEIKYGNIVYFIKNNKRHILEAHKIVKNDISYELRAYTSNSLLEESEGKEQEVKAEKHLHKGFDYNYYNSKYKSASIQMGVGIFLTITGTTTNIASVVFANDSNTSNDGTGRSINVYGIIAFNSGLPLWISGGIKRGNNRRAIKRTQKNNTISLLTFGITKNGIRLLLYL